jgi:hypothetical protein
VTVDVKKWIEIWKKIQYLLAKERAFIAPQVGPTRFEVVQDDVRGAISYRMLHGFICARPGRASRG